MRIVVPIKQVPETTAVKMDEETGTMIRQGVEAIINPLDLYAIETAIRLAESFPQGQCETVAISMGPASAKTALTEAVAMGIGSGVLITDRALAGSDTWATSRALAAVIRKLAPFDLVICGERATDGDTGQVPPGIAAWLDLPVVTYVCGIDTIDGQSCRVRRLVEDGYEVLEMSLPGVLTVVKEIASPRLPTLRGKQRAKKSELPVWGISEVDVPADGVGLSGSPTRVVRIFRPSVARQCEKITPIGADDIETAADRLVQLITDRSLL